MTKVLLVEDNNDERQIFAAMLHYNGFDVIECASATEALGVARSLAPPLILMDIRLPGLNGLMATEILKAIKETAHIRVICMTAADVSAERAAASGADGFLRKPFNATALIEAVHRALRGPELNA